MSDTPQPARIDWSQRTIAAGQEVMAGKRTGLASFLPFIGPAVIASIAYMDPGNFATNIEAGAKYGMGLLWVVLLANLTAMLFQALSAKLGIVTGKSLAQNCRELCPKSVSISMWVFGEIGAMATDMAEFLGAGLGLSLLTGWPMMICLVITGLVTWLILARFSSRFRPMEMLIGIFVAIIGVSYLAELFLAPPVWSDVAKGMFTPHLDGPDAVMLTVGIIGATVMPHALYLHSSLMHNRIPLNSARDAKRVIAFSHREIFIALGFAGFVNMAMVMMSATVFHPGHSGVAEIETAYKTLTPLLGGAAALIFLVSLIASGLSSSVVGTMAGQSIMQDFIKVSLPIWLRRCVTMAPAFVVAGLGLGITQSLVASQAVLSLVLPVPMISLVWLTSRRDVMGDYVNSRLVFWLSVLATTIVLSLNFLLLALTAGVPLPGLER